MIRNASPMFTRVPLRGGVYRPAMGQLVAFDPKVEFKPDVNVSAPLTVELGALPLSLGLFLGSGLAFLMRPQLPAGTPQTLALLAGAGLAAGGILNLILPKAAAAPAAPQPGGGALAPTSPASAPGGGATAGAGAAASDRHAFDNISGRVSFPGEGETVDIWPTSSSYPIRVQLYNPTGVPATFFVEIVANEFPHPFGSEAKTTYPMQVTLGPGQVRDVDINMPIAAWGGLVDYVDVDLNIYKRRTPGEDAQRIARHSLVIE